MENHLGRLLMTWCRLCFKHVGTVCPDFSDLLLRSCWFGHCLMHMGLLYILRSLPRRSGPTGAWDSCNEPFLGTMPSYIELSSMTRVPQFQVHKYIRGNVFCNLFLYHSISCGHRNVTQLDINRPVVNKCICNRCLRFETGIRKKRQNMFDYTLQQHRLGSLMSRP